MLHTMSMYTNQEDLKEDVMRDNTLSDMEKLKIIFSVSKENLKRNDPQLYYAILGVLDNTKIGGKANEN